MYVEQVTIHGGWGFLFLLLCAVIGVVLYRLLGGKWGSWVGLAGATVLIMWYDPAHAWLAPVMAITLWMVLLIPVLWLDDWLEKKLELSPKGQLEDD